MDQLQSKEETETKLYGAIGLHSNNNVTVLIDEQDQVVYQKRLPNDLPLIVQQLTGYRDRLQGIVVESTYNWYWLVDGLMEQGHRVHLANTAAIQQYEGLKYTDDHSDARWLAVFALGSIAAELYLSQRRASGARSFAQAQPTGSPKNDQPVEHPESDYAQHRQLDELEPDQDPRRRAGRRAITQPGLGPGGQSQRGPHAVRR